MEIYTDELSLVKSFAVARHAAFLRKMNPKTEPKVEDPVIAAYKFTNVFRVLDRTTQGVIELINSTIKGGDVTVNLIHQVYLYKLFNRIETWNIIPSEYREEPSAHLPELFNWACERQRNKELLFSNAYLLCTGQPWLPLYLGSLQLLVKSATHGKLLLTSRTVKERYDTMITYPGFGEFLAYQFSLDFSYIQCDTDAYEQFVVPGPGCMRGMKKVYGSISKKDAANVCATLAQHNYFDIAFLGHTLKGNDVQNIFCEFDKYSRVVYPELGDTPMRIKSKYTPKTKRCDVQWPLGWDTEVTAETV